MKNWICEYLKDQSRVTSALPTEEIATWVGLLAAARREGRGIYLCGNGGSAANASHFAVDLGKGASGFGAGPAKAPDAVDAPPRFRVLSLNDNVSWMTALSNDVGYDDVFVEQLRNYAKAGDLFLGVSVSGNSPNVAKALDWANAAGLTTLALVGGKADSRMARTARRVIRVETSHYGRAEDAQMHVLHLLCYAFIEGKA
ncbi:MAG: SIS domain-containing protein [Verrucomicrobiae bacterium]|nr:SIS domain-containing protein [Verrucomicrobiae bacterium]